MKVYIEGASCLVNMIYRKNQPMYIWPIKLQKHVIHFDILYDT